jgi:hypothetical protein
MNKCSALILLACACALLTVEHVEAAPVTWDFVETACGPLPFGGNSCDPHQPYPFTLASLILTGPDSTGSASLGFSLIPTLTGDPFDFEIPETGEGVSTDHPFGTGRGILLSDYDIRWSETAGVLNMVDISINTEVDTINHLGLTGGEVSTDHRIGGCEFEFPCQISGYWVDASLVTAPEPGSLALLASALGVWGFVGRRCTRVIRPRARARVMRAADEG